MPDLLPATRHLYLIHLLRWLQDPARAPAELAQLEQRITADLIGAGLTPETIAAALAEIAGPPAPPNTET